MEMLLIIPVVILLTMVMFGIALHYRDKHGTWAGPARLIFFGWLGLITLDIPLKLTSLAIHCAFWTGFHVEPGKVVQPLYDPDCGVECVETLLANEGAIYVQKATIPKTQWKDGETWDQQFMLSKDIEPKCQEYWRRTVQAAVDKGLNIQVDPDLCLRTNMLDGTVRAALYERVDEVNQTNPDNIFWLTFKRGFEVWDIEADRIVASFRGYEIRLWWLYPLELGCPADRALLTDRNEAVLEFARLVRP